MMDGGRRDTEEILLEQAERLATAGSRLARVIESVPVPTFIHDGAEIVGVNEAALSWLGCSEHGDLVGKGLGALCHAEDEVALLAAVGATSAGPPEGVHLQRFRTRRGPVALGEVLSSRVRVVGARLVAVVVQPLTTTRRSSEYLRLIEAAVDHLNDIVFITEAESIDALGRRVVFVNRAFSRVTGFDASDVLGKTPNVTVGEAADRAVLARIEHRLTRRLPVREELEKSGKDGRTYWVELDIIPVFDDAGRHTHWVSVQRDITERKRLLADLVGAERIATRLVGEASDPIATTMASLESIAQILLDPAEASRDGAEVAAQLASVRQGLERARLTAQRARGILRQLVVLADQPGRRQRQTDLRDVINAAFDDVARDVPIHAEVLRTYEAIPPVLVQPEPLSEVLFGLVLDAAQALDPRYADSNSLFLRISSAGGHVYCEVEATGPGAAAPVRSDPKAPGAELSLLVARAITRSMGAELTHHPSPGTGTRHRLRLSVSLGARQEHESSERIAPRIKSARVLIVEPEMERALELRRLLAAVNHVVVERTTAGAERCLRGDAELDLIFCDISVLGQEARDLYQVAGDVSPELPGRFVFTRAPELPRRLEDFLRASGRPHVEKPFDTDEVRSVLSAVLHADLRQGPH